MIGKYQIQLGAEQLISGMSSSDYATDGALGNTCFSTNPFAVPGIIRGTVPNDITGSPLVDNIIASSEDPTGALKARLMVGDAANYYTVTGSGTITKVFTGSDTTHYTYPRTDIGTQSNNGGGGSLFVSHGTDLAMWNGSTTVTESWWTTVAYYSGTNHPPALSSVPHPMLNYNTNLWVADGSQLHNIIPNAALIATPTVCVNLSVLSLELYSTIYALGVDPATGLMMISYQTVQNQGDLASSQFYIGLYDGYSTGLRRKIPVDDLVTAFQNVGGIVYCMYGQSLGSWNGNGVTFIRKMTRVTTGATNLVFKHRVCNIGKVLYIANGSKAVAYGEPLGGKPKAFFNVGDSLSSGGVDNITCLCPLGNNLLGLFNFITFASVFNLRRYDMNDSTTVASFDLAFNNIYFPRPVFIRRIRVITTGIVHTGLTDLVVAAFDEKNNVLPMSSANAIISVPVGTTYVKDFDFTQAKLQGLALAVAGSNGAWGLVRVIIYYDVAE